MIGIMVGIMVGIMIGIKIEIKIMIGKIEDTIKTVFGNEHVKRLLTFGTLTFGTLIF